MEDGLGAVESEDGVIPDGGGGTTIVGLGGKGGVVCDDNGGGTCNGVRAGVVAGGGVILAEGTGGVSGFLSTFNPTGA